MTGKSFPHPKQSSITVQDLERSLDSLSENEIVAMFFVMVAILIALILLTLHQCQRLQQTMLQRRQWKRQQRSAFSGDSNLLPGSRNDLGEARATAKERRKASYQALQAEIKNLRQIQRNVRSQMSMLEGYVEQRQQQQQEPPPQQQEKLQQSVPSEDATVSNQQIYPKVLRKRAVAEKI
jgi:phage shock protein A